MNAPPNITPGQRGISAVAGRKPRASQTFRIIAGVVVGGAIIGFVAWRGGALPAKKEEQGPATIGQRTTQASRLEATPTPPPPPPLTAPATTTQAPPPTRQPGPDPEPKALPAGVPGGGAKPPQWSVSFAAAGKPSNLAAAAATAPKAAEADPAGTTVDFKPTSLPGLKAGKAIDLYMTMLPQAFHCTLDTAIDTTQPGPFACHLPAPVHSAKGVVLMDTGTAIQGDYKQLARGQDRVFAMAGTAWTPCGVPVPLQAPIADSLGRAGVPGYVESHNGERFGGALLLMASQAAFSSLTNLTQQGNGNSTINLNPASVESVVGEVLRSTINIPPTLTKAQGEDIVIVTTQPIDFSDAYGLTMPRSTLPASPGGPC